MNHRIFFLAIISILSSLLTQSLAEIPTVDNPYQAKINRTIVMEEKWRIGNDENENFILGVIKMVISDVQGNIYLLDKQQSEVFKFSPEGDYLKSVSRKGEGPGELGRCNFFGFWDENTIACFSSFPHKFVRFDLQGKPLTTVIPTPGPAQENDGRMAMSAFSRRDGYLVARGSFFLFENGNTVQKAFLSSFDHGGDEIKCYRKMPTGYDRNKPIVIDEEKDFIPFQHWALGNNGEFYLAPQRTEYLIEVYDFNGNLIRKVIRNWPHHKLTSAEKEDAKNQYSFGVSGTKMPEISYEIAEYAQVINSLSWIDNQLWVTSSEGGISKNNSGTYLVDVFDETGNLLEQRSYQLPVNREQDKIHWLDGKRAVVVKNYKSASISSRGKNATYVRGDGKKDVAKDGDCILEVVLYVEKQ